MEVNVEGTGGGFAEVFKRLPTVEMPHAEKIYIETLDGGMANGDPSCAFIIPLPQLGKVVLAQTSLRLFQLAAAATLGRYGDVTGGGFNLGFKADGEVEMRFTSVTNCGKCGKQIPVANFCMECGVKL